jgi:hypothetical protein
MQGSKLGSGRRIFPRTCRLTPTFFYSKDFGVYFPRLKRLRLPVIIREIGFEILAVLF